MRTITPATKLLATLAAEAALRGIGVVQIDADDGRPEFIAQRGPLCRRFGSLHALHEWLQQREEAAA